MHAFHLLDLVRIIHQTAREKLTGFRGCSTMVEGRGGRISNHVRSVLVVICCFLAFSACKAKTYSMDINVGFNTAPLSGDPPCEKATVEGKRVNVYDDAGDLVATSHPLERGVQMPGTIFAGECGWHTAIRVPEASTYRLTIEGRQEETQVSWKEFRNAPFQSVMITLIAP